jgi:hypothetical protein
LSDYRVLQEISMYLRRLAFEYLRSNDTLPDASRFTSEQNISLDSPARIEENEAPNASQARLSIYLYQVVPNPFINNRGYIPAGSGVQVFPPLSLNLYYLVTPLHDAPEDCLVTLGHVMQVFAAHAVIRARFLDSHLRPEQPDVKLSFHPTTLEDLMRIWNGFNQPYRLSVCYQVQAVAIDSIRQPQAGPPVMEQLVDLQQITGEHQGAS